MDVVVLDASAVAGVLLDSPRHPGVRDLLVGEEWELLVPHLCDLEVASALRKAVRRGVAEPSRAEAALSLYLDLPLSRFPHAPLLRRAFALRDNFTMYDAIYVALAEAVGAPLYTADSRLARTVREHTSVQAIEV